MEDIRDRDQFDQDTDAVLQAVRNGREQKEAEARARFEVAAAAGAASFRQHRKQVRKRFFMISQLCMALVGVFGFLTVYLCLAGGGWASLVCMVATSVFGTIWRWCLTKCMRKKSET